MIQATTAAADTLGGWGKLITPTNPTEFWTLVGIAVGVASVGVGVWLAVLARRGLDSIKHTQQSLDLTQKALSLTQSDMLNRAKRESIQCTVDRCSEMAQELIPLLYDIFEELKKDGIPAFVGKPEDVSFTKSEEAIKINAALAWLAKLRPDLRDKTVPLMNRIESWSMSFTQGLGDRGAAFQPCSAVFIGVVTALYPCYLTQRRMNPASGPYQNTVDLFLEWHGQIAKKKLDEQFELLKRVQDGGAKLPSPIGTSLDV